MIDFQQFPLPTHSLPDCEKLLRSLQEGQRQIVLGMTAPQTGLVTLRGPTFSDDDVTEATYLHEMVHHRLVTGTAYGKFCVLIDALSKQTPLIDIDISRACMDHQRYIQELTATYTEMCFIGGRFPARLTHAIVSLPTIEDGGIPYRELFDTVASVLPVSVTKDKETLWAQSLVVESISHCSFNNDCFMTFAEPQDLTKANLEKYQQTESPRVRFVNLFNSLVETNKLEELIAYATNRLKAPDMSPDQFEGLNLALINEVKAFARAIKVYGSEEIHKQRTSFCARWRDRARVKFLDENYSGSAFSIMNSQEFTDREIKDSGETWPLTPDRLHNEFALAHKQGEGIWTVMSMQEPNEIFVEVVRYKRSGTVNPVAEEIFIDEYLSRQPMLGVLRTETLVSALDAFPVHPQAAIFVGKSLEVWLQATKRQFPVGCVLCSTNVNLSQPSLESLLTIHDIRDSVETFNIALTQLQRGYYFADRNRLGTYVLQKVQGSVGLKVVDHITEAMHIQYMRDAKSIVPHWTLLKALVVHLYRYEILNSRVLDG